MRNEDQLRLALRLLEQETPDTETLLQRVTQQPAARRAATRSRRAGIPGRQLLAGVLSSAAVIAVTVVALILADLPGRPVPVPASEVLHRVPPYYLTFGPARSVPLGKDHSLTTRDVLIKSTITGETLASIRPPGRYVVLGQFSAAANDRTFLLSAMAYSSRSWPYAISSSWLYIAKFDPADRTVKLTRLDISIARVRGNLTSIAEVLISPDGSQIAVATSWARLAQIAVYSVANGAVRTWEDTSPPVSYPLTGFGGDNVITWARDGLLAFDWSYATSKNPAVQVLPQGVRLLNTNLNSGSLIADSKPFCLPEENGGADWGQYLTANGRQIIVPVNAPVKIGERPAGCAAAAAQAARGSRPAIEEFSVRTDRATAIVGQFSRANQQTLAEQENLYWSNPSGTVLVVLGPAGPGGTDGQTLGVLYKGRFTPLPGAIALGAIGVAF